MEILVVKGVSLVPPPTIDQIFYSLPLPGSGSHFGQYPKLKNPLTAACRLRPVPLSRVLSMSCRAGPTSTAVRASSQKLSPRCVFESLGFVLVYRKTMQLSVLAGRKHPALVMRSAKRPLGLLTEFGQTRSLVVSRGSDNCGLLVALLLHWQLPAISGRVCRIMAFSRTVSRKYMHSPCNPWLSF